MPSPELQLVVFAYNFPHKKTQDVLLRLWLESYPVAAVLACDPVELNIPAPTVRTKLRHAALVHPKVVAERVGAPYHVVPHNAPEAVALLEALRPDLGVIAGARILQKPVINAFRIGIINFHPGLIPEARGLDAMLWSIHRNLPLGVTAHLVDHRVDAGSILLRQRIAIQAGDTALDLSNRLYEAQLDLLKPAIAAAVQSAGKREALMAVDPNSAHNKKMPGELEQATLRAIPDYVRRFAGPAAPA